MDPDTIFSNLKAWYCCLTSAIFVFALTAHNEVSRFILQNAIAFTMSLCFLFVIFICLCFILDELYSSIYIRILRYKLRKLQRELEIEMSIPEIIIVEDREEKCTICMESIGIKGRKLECGHYFHSECITRWCKESGSCPNCRTIIV